MNIEIGMRRFLNSRYIIRSEVLRMNQISWKKQQQRNSRNFTINVATQNENGVVIYTQFSINAHLQTHRFYLQHIWNICQ